MYVLRRPEGVRQRGLHDGLMYKEYIIFIYIICNETAFNKLLLKIINR